MTKHYDPESKQWVDKPDTIQSKIEQLPENHPTKINNKYKYNEDEILQEIDRYLKGTLNAHYSDSSRVECFDAWISLGAATSTFRDNALKYLWRYGKKNGNNKDDLMKSIHYIIMMLYNDHYKD